MIYAGSVPAPQRDIKVVTVRHSAYLTLAYPLLRPRGETGWIVQFKHARRVSMLQYSLNRADSPLRGIPLSTRLPKLGPRRLIGTGDCQSDPVRLWDDCQAGSRPTYSLLDLSPVPEATFMSFLLGRFHLVVY